MELVISLVTMVIIDEVGCRILRGSETILMCLGFVSLATHFAVMQLNIYTVGTCRYVKQILLICVMILVELIHFGPL